MLQATLAILYFVTSPFHMSWSLWPTLILNLLALAYLWKHHRISYELHTKRVRTARLVFTITLVALEILIQFTPNSANPEGLLGFVNDSEVFITGILIGILWRRELMGRRYT
jgi:hypothetical protein